jgi:dienelactone hydrolase
VGYDKSSRYPLVIQTHGYAPADEFSLLGNGDSWAGTAFAAQALASHGMVVLQVENKHGPDLNSAGEPVVYMHGYEAAARYLVETGLVHPNRIGLVGWSRTGYHVEYTLTHSDYPFAAAIATDNVSESYVAAVLNDGLSGSYVIPYGTSPFGAGLKSWLENAPGFNADRIRVPLRLEVASGGATGTLQNWEIFARMKELNLPVESDVIPDSEHAEHGLQNARQRLASEGATVDWFDFWLNGHEDPAPEKAGEYARWRKLKEQRDASLNIPKPPLLTWTSTPVTPTVKSENASAQNGSQAPHSPQ